MIPRVTTPARAVLRRRWYSRTPSRTSRALVLEPPQVHPASSSSSFSTTLWAPQSRTMVTVTQTKASETLPPASSTTAETSSDTSPPESYTTTPDSLIVTPSCLQRVEKLIQQRQAQDDGDQSYFLRVYVDAGGCSGFEYKFEIDHDFDPDDDSAVVSNLGKPRVVVDESSLEFLKGATLDFVVEMIKSSFVVRDNPQSESACGCGSSFAVKNFSSNSARD